MGFFDDAEGPGDAYKQFEEGYYYAVVTKAQVNLSDDKVEFEYTVINNDDYKNRKLWRNFRLDARGRGFLLSDLQKYGVDGSGLDDVDQVADALANLIGKEVKVKVILAPKKDKPGEYWTNAYLSEVKGVEMPVSEVSGLPNHAPVAGGPPSLSDNDEIPF